MMNWLFCLVLLMAVNGSITAECKPDSAKVDEKYKSLLRDADVDSDDEDIDETEENSTENVSEFCPVCSCGLALDNIGTRQKDTITSYTYPWLTLLTRNRTYICFGSLINDRYILTAASCICDQKCSPPEEINVIFTMHDKSKPRSEHSHMNPIVDILVHPNFMPPSLDSDIALLKLKTPIKFKMGISPICLPDADKDYYGSWGTVAGLGTRPNVNGELLIMQSSQPIASTEYCTSPYYGYYSKMKPKVTKNMICTSSWDSRLCLNGTGGPLMVEAELGLTQIVGIASWGNHCDKPNKPSVYTKVTKFLDWILDSTMNACYCG